MFLMGHLSGMRVGEIAALKIGDVWDLEGKIKDQVQLQPNQTKGDRARTVFLSEKLRKELLNYIANIDRSDTSKPLFKTQKSLGFTANTLCQHFHYIFKNAQIDGGSSHSMRRTFATTIASRGTGIRVLQKLLGHKNIQTTSIYIDANDDMLRKAVNLM